MVRRRIAAALSFPSIDPASLTSTGVLPRPSAFALRVVERNLGAFDESLPTLRFRRRTPDAELPDEIVEDEPEPMLHRIARRETGAPQPIVPEITAELWWDDLELVDDQVGHAPLVELPQQHTDRIPIEAIVPLLVATSSPLAPRPLVPLRPRRSTPTPVTPGWAIMLSCWLSATILASALWIATAP